MLMSLIIKEIQIKPLNEVSPLDGMAATKRQKLKNIDKDEEKREPLSTVGRNVNWPAIMENI